MRGRGSPRDQGRGRGYFGRSGRSPQNHSGRGGLVPAIGAYLDLPPGKDIVPGAVTKWMIKIKEYTMTNSDTRISQIFGQDGTLGDYPVFVAPVEPPADAPPIDKKKWEIDYSEYKAQNRKLEADKSKLLGTMLGQMSESSKSRAREIPAGVQADSECDPRKLLIAILASHIGDSTLGVAHQLFNIAQRYNNLVMGPYDNLSTYYTNTKSALTAIEQAYEMAGRTGINEVYAEDQMALKFIMGLSSQYEEFKSFYVNNLKPWPHALEDAYYEATKYSPKRTSGNAQGGFERANAFSMTGRRGRSGRGGRGRYPLGQRDQFAFNGKCEKDRSESPEGMKGSPLAVYTASATPPHGYKRGPCNNCGKYGHYAFECRGEPQKMEAKYWNDPKGSGGGNATPPNSPGKGK